MDSEQKLFRCEVWTEDDGEGQGGLFVDFHWAGSLEEIETMFLDSPDEKLYKVEECSDEVASAWQSGYEEGVMVGIVGERIKDVNIVKDEDVFDIFKDLVEEGKTNGQQ